MKLESLKLDKFKDCTLKREQMFMLNGDGIKSGGSNIKDKHNGKPANFNYGYDSYRNGILTFHDRTNVVYLQVFPDNELPTLTLTAEDLLPE